MSKLTGVNPFSRNVSGSIKAANMGATAASRTLSTGINSAMNAVDSMVSGSLKEGAGLMRVINNNLNTDKAKLQTMKNGLTQLQEIVQNMKKTLLTANGAAKHHLPNLRAGLQGSMGEFNKILSGTKFDGQDLLGANHFKSTLRIGLELNNTFDMNIDAVDYMQNGVKAKKFLEAAGNAANLAGTSTAIVKSLGLDDTKDLGAAMKAVIDTVAAGHAWTTDVPTTTAQVKADVDNFLKDLNEYRNHVKNGTFDGATKLTTKLTTATGAGHLKTIVDAGSEAIDNTINAIAAASAHQDATAATADKHLAALDQGISLVHIDTPERRAALEKEIDKIAEAITAKLAQTNGYADTLDSISDSLGKKIDVTEQTFDDLAKADIVKTSQEFVDFINKLATAFGVLASGNNLSKQIVDQARQTLASAGG